VTATRTNEHFLPTRQSTVFRRVLVGIDGSAGADEAARQAALLAEDSLTLLTAYAIPSMVLPGGGMGTPVYVDETGVREAANAVVERALQRTPAAARTVGKVVAGRGWPRLLEEIDADRCSLVVAGARGIGRALGIVSGSTATELVHKAPCSVLIARKADDRFPRRIVVGVDGSPQSASAFAAGRALADRFGAHLRVVVAYGGDQIDDELVEEIVGQHYQDVPEKPIDAILAGALDADLVVVGSRGLHGLAALSSVSERVAHRAPCSVLVVREAPWQTGGF
jgi:nucleotide-binding universal stress UspA family protein